jgi:hypothetical protein
MPFLTLKELAKCVDDNLLTWHRDQPQDGRDHDRDHDGNDYDDGGHDYDHGHDRDYGRRDESDPVPDS